MHRRLSTFARVFGIWQKAALFLTLTSSPTAAQELDKLKLASHDSAGLRAPEAVLFERFARGVVRVEAGLGHGSGFYVDGPGALIATNAHVVEGTSDVSVYVDSATRVPAQVVLRDEDADLAVLRVSAGACPKCTALLLSSDSSPIAPGMHVTALGFPLHQGVSISTGIISSAQTDIVTTDANLNPGNSGGPLLDGLGEVVGINTFRERSLGDAGISGAIAVSKLRELLTRVPKALLSLPTPTDQRLPIVPTAVYPMRLLKSLADSAPPSNYYRLLSMGSGRFEVSVSTPVAEIARIAANGRSAGKDRAKREQRSDILPEERYAALRELRDWQEYVGGGTVPVITVAIVPKVGETVGSQISRGLASSLANIPLPMTLKFQGDVHGVSVLRNGTVVIPLRGGHGPIPVYADGWVKLKDVADGAYYVFSPEIFAPGPRDRPPEIVIVIDDLKNPQSPTRIALDSYAIARAWNDFGPYYQSTNPSLKFVYYKFHQACAAGAMGGAGGASTCSEEVDVR
jgi:hypothetical protein